MCAHSLVDTNTYSLYKSDWHSVDGKYLWGFEVVQDTNVSKLCWNLVMDL